MTWTPPEPCSWYETDYCSSQTAKTAEQIYQKTSGPHSRGHSISTNYAMTVGNASIPLVVTTRDWFVQYGITYNLPFGPGGVAFLNAVTGLYDLYDCHEQVAAEPEYSATVAENCVIEKSTLHYLDQRYGVCLYRYQKDEIHLSVTSNDAAWFKVPEGAFYANMVMIRTENYTASSTVEWRLLIDGVLHVLSHDEVVIEPFGPRNNGIADTDGFAAGWVPDPEIRKILVFPQPPSLAIPLSPEIVRLGFYDYGNMPGGESELNRLDGGYKDMFYPEWCRNLQEDPFWRAAADQRYNISWFQFPSSSSTAYTPPDIPVDPMPIGSFARHPVIGDVYQFLIYNTPVSSPDLRALIDSQLPEGLKTHDTTLIYPISLA